ncbi:MAG: ABC transporter substrate-binding protein [Trueperaceae bacterium]
MKKTLSLLLFTLIFTLLLSSCETFNIGNVSVNTVSQGPATLGLGCLDSPQDQELCSELVSPFEQRTGIDVVIKPIPYSSSLTLALLSELSLTRSPDIDVFQIDVVWPGIFSDDLLNLSPFFSQQELSDFFPRIIANNTLNGQLLAMPYYTDAGLLYYRKDLLAKYGFANPPATWDELATMAKTIQDGERAEGNTDFWGYIWQGDQYEGLTCDAVEWLASEGAGSVVEADGTISINNPKTIAALERAKSWIGTISPPNTIELAEETTRAIWEAGDAAFMRNWPYAYSLGNKDGVVIKGLFDVQPLPAGSSGSGGAALGGWQLAVSKHTDKEAEAIELIKWLTGPEVQKIRALQLSNNPTRRSLYQDPEILAQSPFFERMPAILEAATARPSTVTGAKYSEVTTAFYTSVHSVLTGEETAQAAVANLERTLTDIKGEAW